MLWENSQYWCFLVLSKVKKHTCEYLNLNHQIIYLKLVYKYHLINYDGLNIKIVLGRSLKTVFYVLPRPKKSHNEYRP